jgi:hypothetical protein
MEEAKKGRSINKHLKFFVVFLPIVLTGATIDAFFLSSNWILHTISGGVIAYIGMVLATKFGIFRSE